MTQFIDKRLNGKHKSAVNRQRFLRRFHKQLKKSVSTAVGKRSIKAIHSGETVNIPTGDTKEYKFYYGPGGKRELVFSGNKEFLPGDKIPRPTGNVTAQGSKASPTGEGVDDFFFEISSDEFMDLFFEDLSLPDLVKKELARIPSYKYVRAGYTNIGVPTNINVLRSLKGAVSRRIALSAATKRELTDKLSLLEKMKEDLAVDDPKIFALLEEIELLEEKIGKVPFIDTFDLKYNNRIKQVMPTTQAVMFCVMDVSGSMDKLKKDIAKKFFILLYLFLTRNYEKIDVIFIRHHTSAKEVDEHEFFYSRETGGTVVSSALTTMAHIIEERYDTQTWNIYCAQASDGDNWNADSPHCGKLLEEKLLPTMQYFAYVEIMPRLHQSLWDVYQKVQVNFPNFAMETIQNNKDIYLVFRELFKRQVA